MKVPTIEQDVLPSVQTSRALKLDIERRSEIPVAKGKTLVFQQMSQLADVATDIGNKMRDADTAEEYFNKHTEMLKQSQQIMTDISTDPMYKQYTNDQLFEIYDKRATALRDGLFDNMKWVKAKDKLSNDWALLDTSNKSKLQIAGWQNTIERADKDTINQLVDLSNLGAQTGELARYNKSADELLAARVAMGVYTPEDAVAKKTTFNNNMLSMYGDKYINEGIVSADSYYGAKLAADNFQAQVDSLQNNGIVVSEHIKTQLKNKTEIAIRQKENEYIGWLQKEGSDVCNLYILSGVDRSKTMTNPKDDGKLDVFGNKQLKDDFIRNWELAKLQRAHVLERQRKDTDTQLEKSIVDAAREQGTYREDMLQYITDKNKRIDVSVHAQLALDTYKQLDIAKKVAPAAEAGLIEARDKHAAELAKSEDPNVLRQLNWFNDETNYIRQELNKKHELLRDDPYTYVTDPKWLNTSLIPITEAMTPQQRLQVREANFKTLEQQQLNMNVPRERISYMPLEQVKQDVQVMTQSDATTVAKLISDRKAYFGGRWDAVERQYLRADAPPAFQVLPFATRTSPAATQRAFDLFGTTETKIKESAKAINPNLNTSSIDLKVRKELNPYLASRASANLAQPGIIDEQTNGLVKGVGMYTYSLIASGVDENDAIKQSTKMVNDAYNYKGNMRVPKKINNTEINADTVSRHLARFEIEKLPNTELLDIYNNPIDKDVILRNSRWVTDNSDTYAILVRNTGDPVQRKDRSLIKMRFDDIIEMSYYEEPRYTSSVTMTLPQLMNQPMMKE